jgi:tetratricopeptide (TPR) repeat protein
MIAWHRQQAARCEADFNWEGRLLHAGALVRWEPSAETFTKHARLLAAQLRWDQAVASFTRAIELGGATEGLLLERGQALQVVGEGKRAMADFRRATEIPGASLEAWLWLATAALDQGDAATYRQACGTLVERFGASEDGTVRMRVLFACLLGPEPGVLPARLVEMAGKLPATPTERDTATVLRGLALYRAGRYQECLDTLMPLERGNPLDSAYPLLRAMFLGLALHKLDRNTEAVPYLGRVSSGFQLASPAVFTAAPPGMRTQAAGEVLWREVEPVRRAVLFAPPRK